VSLNGAETPHGVLGSAKNNAKNRSALENAANEDRNCCSTQFFSTLLEAAHIKVEVDGNKVILRGDVRSWAERSDAERAAWAAPGVGQVEDNLTIAA
jgi:BON domain